jgi:hypothetical protein
MAWLDRASTRVSLLMQMARSSQAMDEEENGRGHQIREA